SVAVAANRISLGGAASPSSALILSQTAAGGSTASTMTLSSPSRRSHIRTDSANPGSISSSASACWRSSAASVPSTYSAASASWASSYITRVVLFSFEHDLVRKPVPTPDQVRGRLFRDHAVLFAHDLI